MKETETYRRPLLAPYLQSCAAFCAGAPGRHGRRIGIVFLGLSADFCAGRLGSEFLPHLEEGNFWIRASMPMTLSLQDGEAAARKMREILLRHPEVITVVSQHGRPDDGSDASPFSNVELFAPLKPFDEWPRGLTKEKLTEQIQAEFQNELPGVIFNFSQYIQDNIEEGDLGSQRLQFGQDRRPQSRNPDEACRAGPGPNEPGSRRCRSGHLPGAWAAEPEYQGGSRQGRALWPEFRRC